MKSHAKKGAAPRPRHKGIRSDKNLRLFCDATSQELGTVLATVTGELDYALTAREPASRERSIEIAMSAAERALSLARNLRYFSLHGHLTRQVIDLSQVLLDTVELVEKELELAKIKIAVLAEASTCVRGDPGALQQVLLNILSNARRGLAEGGTITLSLKQLVDHVEVRCSDNGPGMSEEQLENIFEPYAQVSPLASAGSGLGLAVCRTLIESQGGEVQVQSRQGAGTTVNILLPFDPRLVRPSSFEEERRFRRIKLSLPVDLQFSHGQDRMKTELTVLSVGGCFAKLPEVSLARLPELNESVTLQIYHFSEEVVEVAKGRVASVSWAGNQSGLGIEFIEISSRAQKLLTAIVKSHSS
jgi:Histidine kinase-, DNA gyrase B-, and HSP90-like ATPase/PilZ domain